MTTLEIAHSQTEKQISMLLAMLQSCVESVTDYPYHHRTRLVKPLISFDASALALSFIPAAGEGRPESKDSFTYLHLRRDVYDLCISSGVPVVSRYVVPSCHLTIGRFVSQEDFCSKSGGFSSFDHSLVQNFVQKVDELNKWLKTAYWPSREEDLPLEWLIGEGNGLECRRGTLWYGGGEKIRLGRGF